MEELKLKYIRILIGFIVLLSLSSITIKSHVKNITKAKQAAKEIQELNMETQKIAEQAIQETNPEIKQVRIAQEPVTEPELQEEIYSQEGTAQLNNEFEKEGLRKMGEGDYDNAILYFEEAFEKSNTEDKKRVANYLVQCYEQKGEMSGIISVYDRLLLHIQDDNEKIVINNKLASCFMKMGNKEQALKYYEDIYAIDSSKENFIFIGDILIELNDKDKLLAYVQDHLMRYPQDEEFLKKYIDFINPDENSQE